MGTRLKSSRAIASDRGGGGEEQRRMKKKGGDGSLLAEEDDISTTSRGGDEKRPSRSNDRDYGGLHRSSSRDGGRSRRNNSQEPSRSKRSNSRDARRKPREHDSQDVLKAMYGDPNAGGGAEDKEDTTENIESPTNSKETAIDITEAKLDPRESANGESGDDRNPLPSDNKDFPSERHDDECASPSRKPRRAVRGDVSSEVSQTSRRSNKDGLKIPRSSSRDPGRRRPERNGSGDVTPPRTRAESKNENGGKEVPSEGLDDQSVDESRSSRKSSARRRPSGDSSETSSRARTRSKDSARRKPSGDVVANADHSARKTHNGGSQRSSSRDPHRRIRSGDGIPTPRSSSRDPARRSERSSSRDARPRRSGSKDAARTRHGSREGGSVGADQPDKVKPAAAEENKKSVDKPKIKAREVEEEDEKEELVEKDKVAEEVSTTEPYASLLNKPDEGDVMKEKDSLVEKQALRDIKSIDENERAMDLDAAPNEENQAMKEARQEAGQIHDEQEDVPEVKASLQRKLLSPVAEAKPSIMKSSNASEIKPSAKTASVSSESNPAMNLLDYMDTSYQDLVPKSEHTRSEHQRVRANKAPKTEPLSSVSTHSLPARPSKNLHTVDDVASTAAKDFAQVDELFQSMGKKKPNRRPEGTDFLLSDDRSTKGLVKGKAPVGTGKGRKIKKAKSAWDIMGDNASCEGGDPERKELAPPSLAGDRGTKGKKVRRTKASEGNDDEKHLPPPSLAGDEYKKSRKVSKAKHIDDYDRSLESSSLAPPSIAPASKGSKSKPKDHDSDDDEERDTFDDVTPIKKGGTRKILRAPSGVGLPALNLAPPSLAGDEQRIDNRKDRKKASKSKLEGDDKPTVDKRAAKMSGKKSQSFSVLMDADGDDDSVGYIPETYLSKPKSSRGMMTKAKSVTNVMKGKKSSSSSETKKLKGSKKTFSLRNLAI
jgi:hypothetical protein